MAGEDPGVSVFAVVMDGVQRALSAVTGVVKGGFNLGFDLVKTGMYFHWRHDMMAAQQGDKLHHGKQSLAQLREHEAHGAVLVSEVIGDRDAMRALRKELNISKIDYAITKNSSKEYVLHYKAGNEKDVALAQRNALAKRFEVNKDHADIPDQTLQQEVQQLQDERQKQNQEADRTPISPHEVIQPEGTLQEHGRNEQAASADMKKAERTTSHIPLAQSVSGSMKAEVPQHETVKHVEKTQERQPEHEVRTPMEEDRASDALQQGRGIHSRDSDRTPIDAVISEAKTRSRNRSRKLHHNRDHNIHRTANRSRSRDLELSR